MGNILDNLELNLASLHREERESDSYSTMDHNDFTQQAVVFDKDEKMNSVLEEAHKTRFLIEIIKANVKSLKYQNRCFLSEPSGKNQSKEAIVIVSGIRTRGIDILASLKKMDVQAKQFEKENCFKSALARVARTQCVVLSNNFRDVMKEYKDAEMSHKENCKLHIIQQMAIVGRDVSGDQIEEMLENGQWNIFIDNVLSEGKTAQSALNQIESTRWELTMLEDRLECIDEVFPDVAMLAEEQGPITDSILKYVQKTDANLNEDCLELVGEKRHDNNNPFKKLFCGCFPCAKN